MNRIEDGREELLKLASSLDNLADAILKDASATETQIKTAAKRSATDYGYVSASDNPSGYDSFTAFCLN